MSSNGYCQAKAFSRPSSKRRIRVNLKPSFSTPRSMGRASPPIVLPRRTTPRCAFSSAGSPHSRHVVWYGRDRDAWRDQAQRLTLPSPAAIALMVALVALDRVIIAKDPRRRPPGADETPGGQRYTFQLYQRNSLGVPRATAFARPASGWFRRSATGPLSPMRFLERHPHPSFKLPVKVPHCWLDYVALRSAGPAENLGPPGPIQRFPSFRRIA